MKNKLKNALITILASIGLFGVAVGFVACNGGNNDYSDKNQSSSNDDNSDNDNNDDNKGNLINFEVDYLRYLSANITDAKGLGIIRWNTVANISTHSTDTENEDLSVPTTYLVKYTEQSYGDGIIEYSGGGISKVTFSKNTTVTENVYDADGNLIDETATVTQDEIPAQINKIYVTDGYTFIQFIPLDYYSPRPADDAVNMTKDSDGIFDYDKTDYYDDQSHKSFIIDNKTGFIYKIENIHIQKINNGLVLANDGLLYDWRITTNDELQFYSVYQNKTISVIHYFKDKHGIKYIKNDVFSYADTENKVIFYKEGDDDYLLSKQGDTLYRKYEWYYTLTQVAIISADMEKQAVPAGLELDFYLWDANNDTPYGSGGHSHVAKLIDKYLYYRRDYGRAYRVNIETLKEEEPQQYGETFIFSFSYNKSLVLTDTITGIPTLYYGIDLYRNDQDAEDGEIGSALYLILENCQVEVNYSYSNWYNRSISELRFKRVTPQSTTYYRVKYENDAVSVITESEYVADEQNIITLQPINR
jgi:hypothetical protein